MAQQELAPFLPGPTCEPSMHGAPSRTTTVSSLLSRAYANLPSYGMPHAWPACRPMKTPVAAPTTSLAPVHSTLLPAGHGSSHQQQPTSQATSNPVQATTSCHSLHLHMLLLFNFAPTAIQSHETSGCFYFPQIGRAHV